MRHRRNRDLAGVVVALGAMALSACESHARPGARHARGSLPVAVEECDPAGYVRCIRDAALIALPVTNTGLALTYSSAAHFDSAATSLSPARGLGLGDWGINAVHHYDPRRGLLIEGNGAWRAVRAASLPSGELVVPAYDQSLAYVFDAAGRHLPPPGGGNWGCDGGSCGNNGNGFWCKAVVCHGPQGDLCIGTADTVQVRSDGYIGDYACTATPVAPVHH